MCVNDIVVQGAEPLFFMDYFASGKLDETVVSAVVRSIAEGCAQSGCALIGGETAEMPGLYAAGDFDIAGFAVGAAERGTLLPRAGLKAETSSSACRRRAFIPTAFRWCGASSRDPGSAGDARAPFDPSRSLGAALLTPTCLYVRPLLQALKETRGVLALAHITGGGYPDNLPRALDESLAVSLDLDAFAPPPVFSWLASAGGLDEAEMLRTFNCGFGMAAFVPAESEREAREALAGAGLAPVLIGELVPAAGGRRLVTRGRLKLCAAACGLWSLSRSAAPH